MLHTGNANMCRCQSKAGARSGSKTSKPEVNCLNQAFTLIDSDGECDGDFTITTLN